MRQSLEDSFRFFASHFSQIALIIVPPVLLIELISAVSEQFFVARDASALGNFLSFVIDLVAAPFYEAALVFFIASTIRGSPLTVSACWRLGAANWPAFVLLYLALSLAVGFGLALFIVPGLFLLSRLAFAEFELLLDGRTALDAMQASWEATEPHLWTLLGGYLVLLLVVFGPYFALAAVWENPSAIVRAAASAVHSLLGALLTIFAFRVYYEARSRKGPV